MAIKTFISEDGICTIILKRRVYLTRLGYMLEPLSTEAGAINIVFSDLGAVKKEIRRQKRKEIRNKLKEMI